MSLVALDGLPLVLMGTGGPILGNQSTPAVVNTTLDATNEACIMVGRIFTEDGASHTIDTSGSSSLGWMTGAVTFGNAGTTVKVGIAAVDTAAGPAARAVAVTNVITFDVSKTMVGSGGLITTTAWQEHVPDAGTKTIANGDLVAFCVQMTARNTDSVLVSTTGSAQAWHAPTITSFVAGSYTLSASVPNAVITFSDNVRGYFFGGHVKVSDTATVWNSGSATKEYGNYFLAPFPMKVYGLYTAVLTAGDWDLVLYSDPLGTPVAEKTVSIDANTMAAAASTRWVYVPFSSPYTVAANQPIAAIIKPGGTNLTAVVRTFFAATHQKSDHFGTNGYAVSRASGAFAAVNSNKDRYYIGLMVAAFETGVGPTMAVGL